jgi:hypothetical protein
MTCALYAARVSNEEIILISLTLVALLEPAIIVDFINSAEERRRSPGYLAYRKWLEAQTGSIPTFIRGTTR